MIKSGTGTIARKHSKNYASKQADARLKEAVSSYQEQGKRALEVDSFEVKYYQQARGTTTCTCKQTEIIAQHSSISASMPPTLVNHEVEAEAEISIDFARPLFGFSNENLGTDEESDVDDFAIDEHVGHEEAVENPVIDSIFSSSQDCGICYRTGYVPGYNLYGAERRVLTTHNMADSYGYTLNLRNAPHTFEKVDASTGFVEFELEVPRYFNGVNASVRNNTKVLPDSMYHGQEVISLGLLKSVAGSKIAVRVLAENFTHAVIEFDLGSDKVLANLAQMSKTIDWTMFSTLGNMQLILPMTIPEVFAGDLIYVPKRNIAMKVTDVTYLRVSNERNLDWSVNTRVLQPQESLKYISKSINLF